MNNRELRFLIEEFNTAYCNALDTKNLDAWVNFFTEDCVYKITSRQNYDDSLDGGLVFDDSIGMLKDRAYVLKNTQYFAPRTIMHICGNTTVCSVDNIIHSSTNYIYLETLVEEETKLHLSGTYYDKFVMVDNNLKLKQRVVVYDSNLINSALIYPI
jgi:3-phenylpropionate/cinnamic acid dioxygenase small subunit